MAWFVTCLATACAGEWVAMDTLLTVDVKKVCGADASLLAVALDLPWQAYHIVSRSDLANFRTGASIGCASGIWGAMRQRTVVDQEEVVVGQRCSCVGVDVCQQAALGHAG